MLTSAVPSFRSRLMTCLPSNEYTVSTPASGVVIVNAPFVGFGYNETFKAAPGPATAVVLLFIPLDGQRSTDTVFVETHPFIAVNEMTTVPVSTPETAP